MPSTSLSVKYDQCYTKAGLQFPVQVCTLHQNLMAKVITKITQTSQHRICAEFLWQMGVNVSSLDSIWTLQEVLLNYILYDALPLTDRCFLPIY